MTVAGLIIGVVIPTFMTIAGPIIGFIVPAVITAGSIIGLIIGLIVPAFVSAAGPVIGLIVPVSVTAAGPLIDFIAITVLFLAGRAIVSPITGTLTLTRVLVIGVAGGRGR